MVPTPPRPVSMELNLAPMVDVMMCLIIFFMLASTLVSAENRPLNLPWAVAAREVEKKDLGNRVVINVRNHPDDPQQAQFVVARMESQPDGGLALRERVLAAEQMGEYLAAAAKRAAEVRDEVRCVIRADQQVRYRDVEVVLRACGRAHIGKIVFSANAGEEPQAP